MSKTEILREIQRLALVCHESGFNQLGACLAFVGAAAAMCKEVEAANVLRSISQQAADEAKAMEVKVH